jgi:hypothetical protein
LLTLLTCALIANQRKLRSEFMDSRALSKSWAANSWNAQPGWKLRCA